MPHPEPSEPSINSAAFVEGCIAEGGDPCRRCRRPHTESTENDDRQFDERSLSVFKIPERGEPLFGSSVHPFKP